MRVFIFAHLSQAMSAIYTVIAENESEAREELKKDGHTFADNKSLFELECSFELSNSPENEKGIPYSLEIENEAYEG